MTDAFYEKVKLFAEADPELGGISGLIVKALKEYFEREPRQAASRHSEEQAKKLKEYSEWMEKMEKAWRDRPEG